MTRDWQDDAACAQAEHAQDLNVWWAESTSDVYRAKVICASCPVRLMCADNGVIEVATRDPELNACDIGVWGGLTGREMAEMAGEEPGSVQRLARDQALTLMVDRKSDAVIATALGIPRSTVVGWRKETASERAA